MLAVILGAVLSSQTVRPASGIVLALVGALILWTPKAVLAYGFWLSFAAVAMLLTAFGQRLGTGRSRRSFGRAP